MTKINKEEYQILKGLDDKWKWIVRIGDGRLYAFKKKPVRKDSHSSYWRVSDGRYEEPGSVFGLFDKIHLFQFIQWEDKEPYNIAELIEGYEFENELRDNEPEKGLLDSNLENTEGQSREVIHDKYGDEELQNNIDYVESQGYVVIEKPTVPQFVADWHVQNKHYLPSVKFERIADWEDKRVVDWYERCLGRHKNNLANAQETIALMDLVGYEVEKEPKYYAKVKGWGINGNEGHAYYSGKFPLSLTTTTESVAHTKDEWKNYGVYEDNADFLKAEELEK